jgi:capsular polysaccharide biosynthesis protein
MRELEDWTVRQYVASAHLDDAERVPLAIPAQVPNVHFLRRGDQVWRPRDYDEVPKIECAAPGYTLLRDVDLLPGGLALAQDGRFVRDDRTRLTPPTLSPAFARHLEDGPAGRAEWPVSDRPIEKGILVSGPGSKVYGHQLLDYLPGLSLVDELDEFADWPVLLREDAPKWTLTMIEEFTRHEREVKLLPGEAGRLRTRIGALCVPWVVRSPSIHPIVRRVFGRVVRAAGVRGREREERKLYMVRGVEEGVEEKRRLENREEVTQLFADRGFELVRPELMPFMDQVRMFANAAVVAGEGGSGLHGTVFSPAGLITLELRPASYGMLGQPAIAILQRHIFASAVGTDIIDSDDPKRSWPPWSLEVEAVEERLDELDL